MLYLDPRTKQCETEVQKITPLQEIPNQLPDAFTNTKRVTKSDIPAVNARSRIEVPVGQTNDKVTKESNARLKCGRPLGSKDKTPRKRKRTEIAIGEEKSVPEETYNIKIPPEEDMDDINKEVAINYGYIDDIFFMLFHVLFLEMMILNQLLLTNV